MIECPHCKRPAMSLLQKSALGPGRVVPCRSCGKGVAPHWAGFFAAAPAFVGGYAMLKNDNVLIGLAAVAGGVLAMALLQIFLVPLVRGD